MQADPIGRAPEVGTGNPLTPVILPGNSWTEEIRAKPFKLTKGGLD